MSGETKQTEEHPLDEVLGSIANKIQLLVDSITNTMASSDIDENMDLIGKLGLLYDAILDSKKAELSINKEEK